MRVLRGTVATLATVALLALGASPAQAGTPHSTACNDGVGYREVPILTTPVTVGVELFAPPTSGSNLFIVCYSTTAQGAPGGVTGGALFVFYGADGSLASPGAGVYLSCRPDTGVGFAPVCELPVVGAGATPADLPTPTAPFFCLVNVNGSCVATAPGLKVTTGAGAGPTAVVTIVGVTVPVNLPAQCVAIVVPC